LRGPREIINGTRQRSGPGQQDWSIFAVAMPGYLLDVIHEPIQDAWKDDFRYWMMDASAVDAYHWYTIEEAKINRYSKEVKIKKW